MEIKTSLKSKTFKYDFAVDGGAVGSIGMGIFLPSCQLIGVSLLPITPLTSGGGGAAVVNVGILGGLQIIDNFFMGFAQDFRDYNAATFGFGMACIGNNNIKGFQSTKLQLTLTGTPAEVQVTIVTDPLTAGVFYCTTLYIEF